MNTCPPGGTPLCAGFLRERARSADLAGLVLARINGAALALAFLVLCPNAAHGGGEHNATAVHTVRTGDTLWDIAQSIGCRVEDLRRANGMNEASPLRVGDTVQLPRCGGEAASDKVYVVAPGDTLSAIAVRHKTTVEALRASNGLPDTTIRVGQRLTVGALAPVLPLRVVTGQSVGRPQRGRLVDGVRLPYDPGYYRRRVDRAYAAQHVIDHTRRAIAAVRDKYPSVHRLAIGDLSAKRGGRISGHASHQSGRDIDLGFYFRQAPAGYPKEFVRDGAGELHHGATWELIYRLFKASTLKGGPQKIFLDYGVQAKLYKYARKRGVAKHVLAQIFQYPDGRYTRQRLVAHEPMHADHLHVRFACPAGDDNCH